MRSYIAGLNSVSIPNSLDVRRTVQKSIAIGDPADLPRFDYKHLFYDIFSHGDKIIFSGPPLTNLAGLAKSADIRVNWTKPIEPIFRDIKRTQRSYATRPKYASHLSFSAGKVGNSFFLRRSDTETFRGLRVLFTMSKDNDLEWIEDWARFYSVIHGVNAILIYDNNSTRYKPADIIDRLRRVSAIHSAIVVPWPYLYGPQRQAANGNPAIGPYANFSQATMFEHARRRFLSTAEYVVNADIDELILTGDGRTVFDHADDAGGGVMFNGRWIECISPPLDRAPRVSDFSMYSQSAKLSASKWVMRPQHVPETVQWRTHRVEGLPLVDGVLHRHFKGLNTGWRVNARANAVDFDRNNHNEDDDLVRALARVF